MFTRILLFGSLAILGCTSSESEEFPFSTVELSDYQKGVINEFTIDGDEVKGRLDFKFYSNGLPRFKEGLITIFKRERNQLEAIVSLQLKDSLLVKFGGAELEHSVEYDEQKNLLNYQKWEATFKGTEIQTANTGVSDWRYTHTDNCILAEVTSRYSDFKSFRTSCYDEKDRLLSLEKRPEKNYPHELRYFEYRSGILVEKQYFKVENGDTTMYSISKVDSLDQGLITQYSNDFKFESLQRNDVYQVQYSVLSTSPLTIKKQVLKSGELDKIIAFTFNEQGHLVRYQILEGGKGDRVVEYEYGTL